MPQAAFYLAETLVALDQTKAAITVYETALELKQVGDQREQLLYGLAVALQEEGKPKRARQRFEQLLDEYPRSKLAREAVVRLTDTLIADKQFEKSLRLLNGISTEDSEVIATGASIGAFNALAAICRHPDVFSQAICMSGTYDLSKFFQGQPTADYYYSSPLDFVPDLDDDGDHLAKLRERFVLLTHGDGRWEEPSQSWRVAETLGNRGIPNRVDPWGEQYDHDWQTWREMLPKYLDELLVAS